MKIAFITAGAAGMFCGSCMHDNTLVSALRKRGHDALLIPTYTPIRTDEADVSQSRVFFGGINVYLQQKFAIFRWTPWFLDRLLDAPRLLRWVSRFAVKTQAEELGDLTLSMLQGESGYQRKEIEKLVDWLARDHQPDLIHLTNVLLSGMVPRLRKVLKKPILGMLQGDDIFLESLLPKHRESALRLVRERCQEFDGFVATSRYYADFMSEYLTIPREKIHVVYPGLNLAGHGEDTPQERSRFVVGYFARICPEKGFHNLVDAFVHLAKLRPNVHLHASGWLGEHRKKYLDEQMDKLRSAGLSDAFEYVECPDHASKVKFLHEIDVLSVPTDYREPKGLYVLEAWANGVPVVQPRHGSFPELIEMTGGGLLVEPGDPRALAASLASLADDPEQRVRMGQAGKLAVQNHFHAAAMAEATERVYHQYVKI